MMSCKIARNVLAVAVLTASFGAAHAIPTTLTEPLTLNSIEADVDTGDASFAYDLNSYGYDPLLHSLESALLSLVFAVSGIAGAAIGSTLLRGRSLTWPPT